jgi:D-alanyl-lipoteichoic acid acyltransferase DltB (MBOAT superfamily)
MIFTSYTYILFLSVMFVLYWGLSVAWRRLFLIAGSYLFYCTWDWRFGFLLLGISLFNWAYGRWLALKPDLTWPLVIGILVDLTPLLYFKYTNFVFSNVSSVLQCVGGSWQYNAADIILPLGISFFTFQGIAYLVDIWSGEKPFESLSDFLLFKAFWPQLIAGPIIRPHEIYDQITTERTLHYEDIAAGSQRILFGFFKKVVLADTISVYMDSIFLHGASPNAVDSIVGAVGFGLQIYFDFSAYSDIAIGSARLFGFTFPENFDWPYSSASPQDFWNRWHMTLSRWIRDYVFTPIQFATRHYPRLALLWLIGAMAVCGLWHGAQWTFIVWGCWHGLLLVLNQSLLKNFFILKKKKMSAGMYYVRHVSAMAVTYLFVNLAWILFRSPTMADAINMFSSIITFKGGFRPSIIRENGILIIASILLSLIIMQLARKWVERFVNSENLHPFHVASRAVLYSLLIVAIIVFDKSSKAFVYFQF